MPQPNALAFVLAEARSLLGYGVAAPGGQAAARLEAAAREVLACGKARSTFRRFPLLPEKALRPGGPPLEGVDIAAHLEDCTAVYLLALTLGPGPDSLIRRAQATDMEQAVLLDACASAAIEHAAATAEETLRAQAAENGEFLTGRFSPGYGDFPITFQRELLHLLDAPRAIGLTVSESGILLPRKSITAVLGLSARPVTGRLAGCRHCLLYEKCQKRKEGDFCGNPPV